MLVQRSAAACYPAPVRARMNNKQETRTDLFIGSFTIGELDRNPTILQEYDDPNGYTSSYRKDTIKLLLDNPYAYENDLALILAVAGNSVVGRLGFYAGPAHYDGRDHRILWLSGFYLQENYRRTGAGGMILLRALSSGMPLLGCGAPSPELEELYKLVGFHQLGPLRRFVYFYNTRVILKKYINNPFITSLLGASSFPLLKLYYGFKIPSVRPSLTYQPVKSLGKEIDILMSTEKRNHFPKGSALLSWVMKYSQLSAFEMYRGSNLLGYCLVKCLPMKAGGAHNLPAMTIGTLLDYYLAEESVEAKRDMILFCIEFFRQRGLDVFEFQVCDETLGKLCSEFGMIQLGGNRIFFKPGPGGGFDKGQSWFLTLGTADVILPDA